MTVYYEVHNFVKLRRMQMWFSDKVSPMREAHMIIWVKIHFHLSASALWFLATALKPRSTWGSLNPMCWCKSSHWSQAVWGLDIPPPAGIVVLPFPRAFTHNCGSLLAAQATPLFIAPEQQQTPFKCNWANAWNAKENDYRLSQAPHLLDTPVRVITGWFVLSLPSTGGS